MPPSFVGLHDASWQAHRVEMRILCVERRFT
jgi:hypothetical protein